MRRHINTLVTGVAVLGGLSLLSIPAAAQAPVQQGGPDYLGGCVAGTPDPPAPGAAARGGGQGNQAAGRGGRGGGRGATAAPAPAPAPRLPDNKEAYGVNAGKPDFGGLAKGMWNVPYIVNMATQGRNADGTAPVVVPCKPQAVKLFQERQDNKMKDDPEGFCLPPGVPRMMYTPYPTEIFQMPDRILFIYEGGAHVWRIIWMDGRELPKDPNPTFLGYSVGHWEGDTLVVNSIGFNTETWLDAAGHPHGEQLKVTEKFTRPNMNTLRLEATIDDPEYYTQPWTVVTTATWRPGQELMEYICQENNRDLGHIGAVRGK
ncbi:MAG: hypothetical protein JO307_11225 [Bryobacterales bacterium]|nr:hypothetical protein [Bryobacterales bacterium]